MYSPAIPSAHRKLKKIVEFFANQAQQIVETQGLKMVVPREPQIGVYIYDDQGRELFWFGVWPDFWEAESKPLAFGVPEVQDVRTRDAFRKVAGSRHKNYQEWCLSWCEPAVFEAEQPAAMAWKEVDAALQAVLTAAGRRGNP